MEEIHLICAMVQYWAVVNCEFVKSRTIEVTGNFLICRLLKTDTHIITHVMNRSELYGLHSRRHLKCLTVRNIQHVQLSFQVYGTTMFNRK